MNRILSIQRVLLVVLLVGLLSACGSSRSRRGKDYEPIKREFRGAWMPTIFRGEYQGLSRDQARALLSKRINLLHSLGCNVVLFQVRAESDSWYPSPEPWSRFLTGKQGQAPDPAWDPLGFVIAECHKLGMELHAWINPYRGATNADAALAPNHVARLHPEWFVRFNNQLWMDPGYPEGRNYLVSIAKDLVTRYDVDALHIDDYFYPYPIKGIEFNDDDSFSQYGLPVGYTPESRANWRRNNVSLLISELRSMLLKTKPWVRLGISPFGIYRNQQEDYPKGSRTNGSQSYDDLYADVLQWVKEDWVDYVAPQIYWNIGNEVADYEVLVKWWSKNIKNKRVQLYIGQDIKRTMQGRQLQPKIELSREYSQGNIWWPADELFHNYEGIGEQLRRGYQAGRALLPEVVGALGKANPPAPLDEVWEDINEDGHMLLWNDVRNSKDPEKPYYYAVYAFSENEKANIKDFTHLVSVSTDNVFRLPAMEPDTQYTFLITTINRFWQESKPYKIVVTYRSL